MEGLFLKWLSIVKKNSNQKVAIEELNYSCGTKYTESWPSKMKGRNYSLERVPTNVRRYMMRVVLPELIPGKSDSEYNNIIKSLT